MVQSRIRWRRSMGAQEMCGVRMQFFACRRGLSLLMGDLAAVQRVGQILLGHELSAGVVDEDHAVFHLGDVLPADDLLVLRRQIAVQGDHVRGGEQRVQIDVFADGAAGVGGEDVLCSSSMSG
mgnify:CR=1 FL=1